jgi:uncharacterized protein YaaN involved in tellurite resistance
MVFQMSGFINMSVMDEAEVKEEVTAVLAVKEEEKSKLSERAKANVTAIMDVDLNDVESKRRFIDTIENFGAGSIKTLDGKNNLLKTSVGNLSKSGDEGGEISASLMALSKEIKDLDPSGLDFAKKGVLGKLTNPIRNYFLKYERSDKVIANLVESLNKGQATLKNDNVTLSLEEQVLRDTTVTLNKEIEMGRIMDSLIEEQLVLARADENPDEEKIRFVEEEVLFPLRQRVMDMNQKLVVAHQGIIAMEIIQRNNRELIRGVNRVKDVTLSALRTGVMVASALYNQKIVLQKIDAINKTTSDIIAGTSKMLKEQGAAIQRQAAESTISADVLQTAFDDCMTALEDITTYKRAALPLMKDNIAKFRELADKGETEIRRLEKGSTLSIETKPDDAIKKLTGG